MCGRGEVGGREEVEKRWRRDREEEGGEAIDGRRLLRLKRLTSVYVTG